MPCDFYELPHPGIKSLQPYAPGRSREEVAKEYGLSDIVKLSSNENPLGCSPKVSEALANLPVQKISSYPIAARHAVRSKIAKKLSIDDDMITMCNGSDGMIPILLNCFALHCNKSMLTHDYAFISYSLYAQMLGIPVSTIPLLPDWRVDIKATIADCHEKTALIFLASPNNPTGIMVSQSEIEQLLQNIPSSTLLVIDEAYYEYVNAKDRLDTISLLSKYPNLIILRTFSKAYGLAGLRLGYCIANVDITTILRRVSPPFCVNQAGLAAAIAAMDDEAFLAESVKNNELGMAQLTEGLTKLNLTWLPSSGNFIMFDCKSDAHQIFQHLLQRGVIVRPLTGYYLETYIRVTIGTPEQNERFLKYLEEVHHS